MSAAKINAFTECLYHVSEFIHWDEKDALSRGMGGCVFPLLQFLSNVKTKC